MAVLKTYKHSADRAEFSKGIAQKVYELRMYGLNNELWLDERVRRKAWQLTDKLRDVTTSLLYDEGMYDIASNLVFDDTVKRVQDEEKNVKALLDELSKEAECITGTAQSWWRKMFVT